MNIPLFFNAHTDLEIAEYLACGGIAHNVEFHHQKQRTNWKAADVALFSIYEYRGATQKEILPSEQDLMRIEFYKLQSLSKPCHIVDLGTLRAGHHLEETYLRLAEVCETLLNHNTLPLIIGGSHDLDYGQFMAYQNMEKLISILQVDAKLDLAPVPKPHRDKPDLEDLPKVTEENHLRQILMHHPNFIFDCNHLGHQRFLNDISYINTLKGLNFDIPSVGDARSDFTEMEPLIRMSDMLSFDIAAIRRSEFPAQSSPSAFGFTADEACQLCWYAGTNESLSSCGLYGYRSDLDQDGYSSQILAVMVWYFLEGVAHRQQEYSFNSNFYVKYFIQISQQELTFYKSKISEKWWMEIGHSEMADHSIERPLIIPCSYKDYEKANQGEVPERWLRAQAKPE